MSKGQIRVQTENIFPIIKKFLYSEHEIFLRELVSNAVDASQKLHKLSQNGEATGDIGDIRISVSVNKDAKTITISDQGIGMTAEEVDKYINQVAFSSAEEFLEKYKDAGIIGHFGLGFYSAFMVSDKVEIHTKSWKDAPATRWSCDGSPSYEINESDKTSRGTDIILYVNTENEEFLDVHKLEGLLKKFGRFLPVPIYLLTDGEEEKKINNTIPLWTRKPADLTSQDYQDFYKELYPFSDLPLFWIHLNVDYPFNLTGVLYFPKIKQSYEIQKDKIQLYSNQVFVTDEVKDIVPEFLMLLHGVIDSPDIPLNVSRSYLQGDPNVKKINSHITKKVADKLDELFRNERKELEEKWESLDLFVKYGMITDDKFLEKGNKFLLLKDAVSGHFYTLDEYKTNTAAVQTNKDGKQVILYATNPVQQDAYIKACTEKGYVVVQMESLVDAAFINHMEMKWEKTTFTRVDADIADHIIDKAEEADSVLSKEEEAKIKEWFGLQIPELHIQVDIKSLNPDAPPVIATRPEMMRRMKDMASAGGGMASFYAQMPDEVTLTVNGNHGIFQKMLKESDTEKVKQQVRTLADLALLSQGLLKGNDLTHFINRTVSLIQGDKKSTIILEP
jgi:molecular chaperone HtpG